MVMSDSLEMFLRDTRLRLLELLDSGKYDFEDEETFATVLSVVWSCCGVTPKDLYTLMRTNPSNFWRWRTGSKVPAMHSRAFLIGKVRDHLRKLTVLTIEPT